MPHTNAILRWPSGAAQKWADTAFRELCSHPDVLAVVLFGSTVRPALSSFDLDCLYVYQGEQPAVEQAPLDVDIRGYPADQVDRLIQEGHDLLGWSLRLGRLVCERDGYWTRLFARWQGRLPFPSAEIAEARAVRAERLALEYREMGDDDAAVEQWLTAITHRARAVLLRANVFPASRPELPSQLRSIGGEQLATVLEAAILARDTLARQMIGTARNPARNPLAPALDQQIRTPPSRSRRTR
jgi:hypothetical protein